MKTITVSNYIYDNYNERGMKAFEKKVLKVLKDNNLSGDVICHGAFMRRGDGRGSYFFCAEIEIDGEVFVLNTHTNDSEAWDNWENPTAKQKRELFLSVLEDNVCLLKN